MNEQDWTAEYERRLNRWHGSSDAWHHARLNQIRVNAPPSLKARIREAIRAEALPNPCRTMTVWDEEEDRLVRRRVEVDENAIDRGES